MSIYPRALAPSRSRSGARIQTPWDGLVGAVHVQVRDDAEEQRVLAAINALFAATKAKFDALSVQLEKEQFLLSVPPEERMLEHL